MKKKPAPKRKGRHAVKPKAKAPMTAPFEPKPFSAHFHAEGSSMDEVHGKMHDFMSKHLKGHGAKRKAGKGKMSVEEALS